MIRVVVGILMNPQNKVLIAKRPAHKPYPGLWEFPGGKIEPDESGEAALKRELQEELGIEVIGARNIVSHQHVYPDKTVFLEVWLISMFSGEPQGLEGQALRWVNASEIKDLRLLEGNWAILERILTEI